MANRTDPAARTVHGTNPQNLVEKIVRSKIYQNAYWKEACFGLTAETLVDKAMELDHFGGTHGGNRKPAPFLCLILKMLQIQPEKEIVVEFIKNEDYKYVRILGAFYLRLVGKATDVYQYLEPLYNDYRKLRRQLADGNFVLSHVDEFIEELLTKDMVCDIALPRLPSRPNLERSSQLEPRRSALEDDFEEEEEAPEEEEAGAGPMDIDGKDKGRSERDRERDGERKRDGDRDRGRDNDRGRDRDRDRDRERDRDRDRHRDRDDHYRDRERDRERGGRDYERDRERGDRDRDRRHRSRSRDRELDRHHDKDRDRDRERRRHRSRSASPDRRKRHRSPSPGADGDRRRREEKEGGQVDGRANGEEKKEKKKKKEPAADGTDHPDPEIAEANRLRASLGLKPLR